MRTRARSWPASPCPPTTTCGPWSTLTVASGAEADERISAAAVGWPLDRMAVIDRIVLRLAVAELLDPEGPPTAVVIDEAVELVKAYSTEESGRFVNGVLATIAGDLSAGTV